MTNKMSFTDNQTAFEYAAYMIIGSYYNSAKCTNPMVENSKRLNYLEQRLNSQYHMENSCIWFVEKELKKSSPKGLFDEDVEVKFLPKDESKVAELQFIGKKYILRVRPIYVDRHGEFTFEVLGKRGRKKKAA